MMALPGAHAARRALLAEVGVPDEIVDYVDMPTEFDTTHAQARRSPDRASRCRRSTSYADKLWDYWRTHLDPDLSRYTSVDERGRGQDGADHRGVERDRQGDGAAAGPLPARPFCWWRAAPSSSRRRDRRSSTTAAARMRIRPTSPIPESVDELLERVEAEHPRIDILVNNAGRSIRRSIALSYDRFHDFERTMQLNYLGTIRLIMGLLPRMREQRSGHVINISSIGVQTNPPRFSAYVASKSALDAWTRVVSSECIADNVHFTTIHMPLVKTPMIAPTKLYDRFPTITPEQAAEMIAEAIRTQPKDRQHHARHGRRGQLRAVPEAGRPGAVDRLQGLPGLGRGTWRARPDGARLDRAGAVCQADARHPLVIAAANSRPSRRPPRPTSSGASKQLGDGSEDHESARKQSRPLNVDAELPGELDGARTAAPQRAGGPERPGRAPGRRAAVADVALPPTATSRPTSGGGCTPANIVPRVLLGLLDLHRGGWVRGKPACHDVARPERQRHPPAHC